MNGMCLGQGPRGMVGDIAGLSKAHLDLQLFRNSWQQLSSQTTGMIWVCLFLGDPPFCVVSLLVSP